MEPKEYELTECQGHDGATMQLPPGLALVTPDHQGYVMANGTEITVSLPTAEFERLIAEGTLIEASSGTSQGQPAALITPVSVASAIVGKGD